MPRVVVAGMPAAGTFVVDMAVADNLADSPVVAGSLAAAAVVAVAVGIALGRHIRIARKRERQRE